MTFCLIFIPLSNFECKISIFSVQAESTQKFFFLVSNPIFFKNFPILFWPPIPSYANKTKSLLDAIISMCLSLVIGQPWTTIVSLGQHTMYILFLFSEHSMFIQFFFNKHSMLNPNRVGLLDVDWVRGGWISPDLLDHPKTLWKPKIFWKFIMN